MPLASLEAAPTHATVAAGLAGVIAIGAISGLRRARGTTLAAPAAWAIAAAGVFAVVEATLAVRDDLEGTISASLMRYAAAAGSCCPIMAVLGAKRPQDRGWQWVVASLWIVLLVPAGQAWAAGAGDRFEPPVIWRGLLVVLMALVLMNYSPTRHIAAAIVFTAGQVGIMAPHLAQNLMAAGDTTAFRVGGLLLVLLAAVGAMWPTNAQKSPPSAAAESWSRFQRRWLAFRDGWGAFWGLRVMNRVNESAQLGNWPVRLAWGGLVATHGQDAVVIDDHASGQIEQSMDSLLRRFERVEAHTKD